MTVRVVTAVLLAVALLGAVLPAVDAGRAERTATLVDGELTRFERAVDRIADEDPTRPGVRGARRTVTLRVPSGSWTAASATYLAIGGVPAGTPGGPARSRSTVTTTPSTGTTGASGVSGPTDGAGTVGPTDGAGTVGPTDGAGTVGPTDGARTVGPTDGTEVPGPTDGPEALGPSEAAAADRGTVVAYRVGDRTPVVRRLDGPRILVRGGPIVLVGGDRQRLELGLVRGADGQPVVLVRRG